MATTFKYVTTPRGNKCPVINIRLRMKDGPASTTVIDIEREFIVDTGASHTCLPVGIIPEDYLLASDNVEADFADDSANPAGMVRLEDVTIEFLDEAGQVVHDETEEIWAVLVLEKDACLLGRDIINKSIYEFIGPQKELNIRRP